MTRSTRWAEAEKKEEDSQAGGEVFIGKCYHRAPVRRNISQILNPLVESCGENGEIQCATESEMRPAYITSVHDGVQIRSTNFEVHCGNRPPTWVIKDLVSVMSHHDQPFMLKRVLRIQRAFSRISDSDAGQGQELGK